MNRLQEIVRKNGPILIVALISIAFYEVLEHFGQVLSTFQNAVSLLMPFFVGLGFAWLLDIPTRKLQEKWIKRRWLAVLVVLVCVGIVLWLLGVIVVPQVRDSIVDFVNDFPEYSANLLVTIKELPFSQALDMEYLESVLGDWQKLSEQIVVWVGDSSKNIFEYGIAIGHRVYEAVIAFAAMLFIMLDKDHLVAEIKMVCRAIFADSVYEELLRIWHLSDKMLSGFLLGKFADSLIVGLITAVVMLIFRMPLASLISVIVCLTNIIPVAGPFIGGGVGAVLLLLVSPKSVIPFLIMILIIQQLDGNIIGPKILGDRVGLPTIWSLFAIVIGGKIGGAVGMVLGVPVFAVFYTLAKELVEKQLIKKGAADMIVEAGVLTTDEILEEHIPDKTENQVQSGKAEKRTKKRQKKSKKEETAKQVTSETQEIDESEYADEPESDMDMELEKAAQTESGKKIQEAPEKAVQSDNIQEVQEESEQ